MVSRKGDRINMAEIYVEPKWWQMTCSVTEQLDGFNGSAAGVGNDIFIELFFPLREHSTLSNATGIDVDLVSGPREQDRNGAGSMAT